MTIANVELSNTFNEFRTSTNEVINRINTFVDGTGTIYVSNVTTDTINASGAAILGSTLDVTGVATFSSNVEIAGNLIVTGNTTQLNINELIVDDPVLHLAANNEVSDIIDIGFVGHYSDDGGITKRHTGIFRDASEDRFYIFHNYIDPDLDNGGSFSTFDVSNATFLPSDLVAGNVEFNTIEANSATITGSISATGNVDSDYINANTGIFTQNVTAAFFIGDGSQLENAGAVISDDDATATPQYIIFNSNTSGPATSVSVSSTKLLYVPSTGNLTTTILTTDTISGNTTFSSNGQIRVPTGTTGERVTDTTGAFRFNLDLGQFEGYNGAAWGAVGGGATGGSGDQVFYENEQTANNTYTITPGKNAMTTGPITIADGATVTVPSGSRLVIL